jgi:hypothetical protein
MTNFKLKLSLVAFFFGFMVIGSLYAQNNSRLNGSWFWVEDGVEAEYRLNNGNFELMAGGVTMIRGTYTTSNEEITFNITHVFGLFIESLGISGFDLKWYPINEFTIALRQFLSKEQVPEAQINEVLNSFGSEKFTYSVDANSLILRGKAEGQKDLLILRKR